MIWLSQIIIFGILTICTTASIAQNTPVVTSNLTQAQALDIAAKFSATMGHPLTGHSPYQPNTVVAPQASVTQKPAEWKFTQFDGKNFIDVEVVAATGVVSGYMHHTDTPDPQPEDASMSQSEAVAQATAILTKAGAMKTNELVLHSADIVPSGKDSTEWWVSWDRIYQGVIYHDQGANVGFDGETGQLLGFGVRFKTPPPATMTIAITQAQAASVADEHLQEAGRQPGSVLRVKAEIVQPNTFWQPGGSEANPQSIARAAWVCQYESNDEYGDVWVDRETGQVIGGTQYSNARYVGPSGGKKTKVKPKSKK